MDTYIHDMVFAQYIPQSYNIVLYCNNPRRQCVMSRNGALFDHRSGIDVMHSCTASTTDWRKSIMNHDTSAEKDSIHKDKENEYTGDNAVRLAKMHGCDIPENGRHDDCSTV